MFDDSLRRHLREHCKVRNAPLNLLVAIVRLSRNADGCCWARISYLGQFIERAERTVRSAIAALRSLGLIRTRATGRNLIYTPAWEKLGLAPAHGVRDSARTKHVRSRDEPAPEITPNEGQATGDAEDAARVVVPPAETTIESVGTRREDEPVNRPSAPADEALAQVAERFGADAARDVAEVIASDRRATTDVARVALERLLAVEPARLERSAGAYFRRLVELASDARLAPLSRRPPRCAAEPREDDVKAQIARVNALKDELQRADLSIEQHRQLTHALHQETDALIRLRAAKNARDQTKVVSRMAPLATPPPPPPRPRAGPLPDWLATFIHEQLGDAGATSTDPAVTP